MLCNVYRTEQTKVVSRIEHRSELVVFRTGRGMHRTELSSVAMLQYVDCTVYCIKNQSWARSWIQVPAFLRSCVPGVLGTRTRGNAIFFKAPGNAEREEVGTLILRA